MSLRLHHRRKRHPPAPRTPWQYFKRRWLNSWSPASDRIVADLVWRQLLVPHRGWEHP